LLKGFKVYSTPLFTHDCQHFMNKSNQNSETKAECKFSYWHSFHTVRNGSATMTLLPEPYL